VKLKFYGGAIRTPENVAASKPQRPRKEPLRRRSQNIEGMQKPCAMCLYVSGLVDHFDLTVMS
jgi:hypothetical protein